MLRRRREEMILLLGLIALNGVLGWRLVGFWKDYRHRTQWIYARPAPTPATSSMVSRESSSAGQDFAAIITRNLFRPERSSQTPGEEAKRPELPILYGTMNVGTGWFALMAPGDQLSGLSKRVLPGEEIGGYKLVSIAGSQVVVDWLGKRFPIDASESARRVARSTERTSTAQAPVSSASPASGRAPQVNTIAPTAVSPQSGSDDKRKFTASGYNAPPGAPLDAPAGTVIGGKRKVVMPTPFGNQVWWEDVPPPKPSAGTEAERKP